MVQRHVTESIKQHRQFLEAQAAQVDNPAAGFFGPGSMAWRISREVLLGLIVLRALFMQVAHPKVAQGVADHSDFRRRPVQRALSTFRSQQKIVFGSCEEAIEALMRIYARHTQVRGRVSAAPAALDSPDYDANDPALLLWVYATLIDSMFYAYRTFLPDLSSAEWDAFYEEGKLFARLIGIPEDHTPPTLDDFNRWMSAKIASEEITIIPVAKEISASLLSLPVRLATPLTSALVAGSLPPSLRRDFGLPWGPTRQRAFDLGAGLLRGLVRYVPVWLRTSPAYWVAKRQARKAEGQLQARP